LKKIRQRDTLFYWVASMISFFVACLGFSYLYYGTYFPGTALIIGLIILGLFDVIIMESTRDIYRLSRMNIAGRWLFRSLVYSGIVVIVFSYVFEAPLLFMHFLMAWVFLFLAVLLVKMTILTWSSHRLKKNKVTYRTLFIGSGPNALPVLTRLMQATPALGQEFVGYLGSLSGSGPIPLLGPVSALPEILAKNNIEEITIALDREDSLILEELLRELRSSIHPLLIRITPESYDFLLGRVKLDAVYGTPLIELPSGKLSLWQQTLKRTADILVSVLLLILLLPLILYIIIRIKWSSRGPVFYRQERIGRSGRPFIILKFRSMYQDAEPEGPQLSFEGDQRCTPWGSIMRKWRLDEIPQFVNVFLGEMSLVGPRPERKYFIDQIKLRALFYNRILTVRPGITSWGQVKYGYASNIDQMIERLQFDLIYVENLSLSLDIKIILYTILVLYQGKGK